MAHEFPGFRALRRIHAGSRSTVDRALRVADAATVIVKQPVGDVVAAEALARVVREFEILHAVRGPGVIDALEVLRDGSHAALVFEDVGCDLASCLVERRLSIEEALDIAIAVARSLAHIHAAGVIHRDINPSNILYDPLTHRVKLIDFDLASRAHEAGPHASVEGTLHYLAPEQTGRLDRRIDERSDLYALGITLYELFTGRRPFDGDNALAVIHAHLAERPSRIDDFDSAIPSAIGDIAMKLVAKAPEQRYQTATGVLADLERCRRELAETGRLTRFAIARHDVSARLEFSDRLYGREAEVRALLDAFARTSRGAVETVLVSGYSGIGKSSVVRELIAAVAASHGFLASGKFEQLGHDVPYSAVIAAIEQRLARILAEPALDRWTAAIAAALGENAPLVRSVLPALERLLGPQPPAPVLEADTARRRLALAMARLVQVFARKAHPLVMFLDDMQWADKASLELLTQLATSDETESLLVIEAYRDNEIDAVHPFAISLRDHQQRGAKLSRIELTPLTLDETAELVADALRLSPEQIRDAASVIWRKTQGNPFFIRQFVHALYDEGCIAFDARANAFTIDVAAIDQLAITDNVADLLARQLGKLPAETRDVLVTAAAIGTEFDLATLAMAGARGPDELPAALAPAVEAGMISPLAGPVTSSPADRGSARGRYRFQHDWIQEAAYEAAPADARERLHLTIGRQLLSTATADELDARVFEVVHHLSRGLALIDSESERARFIELALEVARRARRSGAFDVAATAMRAVCSLHDWRTHHAAWFATHLELAEVLSLGGQHRDARQVIRAAYPHASDRERATLGALEVRICDKLGAHSEALASGRRAAALLGVELPSEPAEIERQIGYELDVIMAAMAERPIEQWIDLPIMTDAETLAVIAILIHCTAPAYHREPALMGLLAAKLITLSLRHGNCNASAHGYGTLAITLWVMGLYDTAFRFGKLGVDLAHRLEAHATVPSVEFMFAAFAAPWQVPIDDTIDRLRSTVSAAIEVGDLVYAGYAMSQEIIARMVRGERLDDVIERARRYRKLCTRLGLHEISTATSWYIAHARSFTGSPPAPDETAIDFAAIERQLVAWNGSRTGLALCRILELERRYWRGDAAGVVELARTIGPVHESSPGNIHNAEVRLYYCLSAIAIDGADAAIAGYRGDLARYADANPASFGHMAALVEAELARVRGDVGTAIAMYDAAIDAAADSGFVKLEAIAHELAARFWSERRKPAFAAVHLGHARDLCHHWGARPRAREIELRRRALGATAERQPTTASTTAISSTLDFATVLKASHALATDMVLDSLLGRMMEIIIENTGAQAGSIVLDNCGALFVHASKAPHAEVTVGGGVPLASARDVSAGIVTYALRTAECIVLGNATRHPTFRTDPYVRERRPRSVLCLPIVHKERVIGAVYLENNLVTDAFTVDRLDALGVLVAQLAVSIENAMIFARLEELVAERTRALTEANHQLRVESLARERMESQLRLAQKLQSVGQLAAGIAHEINTPMQYIGDNIAFLDDSIRALLSLIDAYRTALDTTADHATAATVRQVERELDLDYVCGNAQEACVNARDGVVRVSRIITAMKTFSHPGQRDQSPTALAAAIESALVVAQHEYRHVADVVTEFAELPDVVCHRSELNQVFLNLIVNAAHAIRDVVKQRGGRGTITIRTRRESADTVVVAVSDTGGGIPEAIAERVFDPFFTTKEVGHGTGQGLALARTVIVDRHGGAISFESEPGSGTTFFIRLPIRGCAAGKPVAAAS